MSAVRKTVPAEALTVSEREFSARLGQPVSALPAGLAAECRALLVPALTCRYCHRRTGIRRFPDGTLDLGFGPFESRSLQRNLAGCREAILFAATIGPGADRLLRRLAVTSPAKRFVTDALASAFAEALCDHANRALAAGLSCAPRFSPGYGDLPLAVQPGFLTFVDAGRLLGITLSESLFMNPSKSVTAIIGIRGEAETVGRTQPSPI